MANFKILLLSAISLLTTTFCIAQKAKQSHFFGINPSVTVEPFYDEGELDINILPIVHQLTITKRIDIRTTSILNYGIRNGSDRISHFGLEAAMPVFFKQKDQKSDLSKGFYFAPIASITRNNELKESNVGLWIEPGYNLLFENQFALTFGLQLGGTYFIDPDSENTWGNHFGIKVILGKWF